jgi:type II secretion system protein N
MKIKLPAFRLGRGPSAPSGPSGSSGPSMVSPSGTLTAEPAMGGAGDQLRLLSRRVRGAAGWVAFFLAVFFVFVWVSLPTRAIAWRIGQAARDAGFIVEIEDVSISPFGGASLYNVTWTFQPSHSGQIPRKLELAQVDVDVSLLKLLWGNYDVELDTAIDEATIHAAYTRSDSESTVKIDVDALALYDVPKLQQAVNAPLVGLFALHVDMTMPENQFAKATGSISIECSGCKIGDGETLMFVPGASGLLSKGLTLPEIDLGTLTGTLVVADGKATAEKFETSSDDITLKITGGLNLADPFSKSEFAFDLKLLLTPALQERSEPLKLMYQTAGPSTKMDPPDDAWLGFKLRGSAGKPKFMGIKSKSREERDRERRQASLEREAKRKAAKAKRDREKKSAASPSTSRPAGRRTGRWAQASTRACRPTTARRPRTTAGPRTASPRRRRRTRRSSSCRRSTTPSPRSPSPRTASLSSRHPRRRSPRRRGPPRTRRPVRTAARVRGLRRPQKEGPRRRVRVRRARRAPRRQPRAKRPAEPH